MYNYENGQIVSVKTFFFGEEGEFSRGKIIDGAKADQMIIKFIDYETTELKVSRSKVFPYGKEFTGPDWVNIKKLVIRVVNIETNLFSGIWWCTRYHRQH